MRAGTDIVDSSSHFPMIGAQLCAYILSIKSFTFMYTYMFTKHACQSVYIPMHIPLFEPGMTHLQDRLHGDGMGRLHHQTFFAWGNGAH
jgi:hypothetical protein